MGNSHYYPRGFQQIHYRMVNLDMDEKLGYSYDNPDYAEDESGFHTDFQSRFVSRMQRKLEKVAPTGHRENDWDDDDARRIYRTPLLDITLTDNQVLFAIVVKPRSDFDGDREANLAPRHIDRVAKQLFDYVQAEYGELTVPHGGYMSGKWNGDINNC